MNVAGFSDKGLHALWHGVKVAFDADSESIELGKEPEYGVRTFNDWKEWSDQLEAEMSYRKMTFDAIPW